MRIARLFLFAAAAIGVVVLTISTWLFLNDEDGFGPEGVTHSFSVSDVPHDIQTRTVTDEIARLASELRVNVYKPWPSANGDARITNYYLFAGDENSILGSPRSGTFPSFGHMYSSYLKPGADLTTRQLYGSYAVFGTGEQTDRFATTLSKLGLRTSTITSPPAVARWPFEVAGGPLGAALVTAWLALFLASMNALVSRMVITATRISVGFPRIAATGYDVAALFIPCLVVVAAPAIIISGYTLVFSGGYRILTATTIALVSAPIMALAPLTALALQRTGITRFTIGKILSGARPARLLTWCTLLTIAISACFASTSAIALRAQQTHVNAERSLTAYWERHPSIVSLTWSYAYTTSDQKKVDGDVAEMFTAAEHDGTGYLSAGEILDAAGDASERELASRTMIVDSNFLETLPEVSPSDAARIRASASRSGGAVALIPSDLAARTAEITGRVTDFFQFQKDVSSNPENVPSLAMTPMMGPDISVAPRFDVALTRPEQIPVSHPVIIVTNASSRLLAESTYAASGAYVDHTLATKLLEDRKATAYISQITRISDASDVQRATDETKLWGALIGFGTMLLTLLCGWTLVVSIYLSRNRARLFLQRISGCNFSAMHGRFVLQALAFTALPALGVLARSGMPPAIIASTIAAAVGLCFATTVTAIVMLGAQHQRSALQDS